MLIHLHKQATTTPKSPQTNGMVERFNGRIEEILQSHHFRSGEELGTTMHRYVWLYNQQLPQSALGSKAPLQAMKDWHKLKPELFKKQPYYLPGCDNYRRQLLDRRTCPDLAWLINRGRGDHRHGGNRCGRSAALRDHRPAEIPAARRTFSRRIQ